ncbi:hypothetical protein BVRB_025170, partial [Beta vulgaris subsp. vulgaris]
AESLVQDCVGRYITTGRGALRLTNLINSKSYAEAWTAVQRWAQRHFELGNSFIMSPIGVMNQTPGAPPQFAFFQSFIDKFGLETNNVARDTDASTVVKMYTSALAKYAPGLERERLKLAVQHLIQRLGEIIANRSQCLIEFGFATLVAEDRRVAMVLHVRPDQDGLRNDAEDNRKSLAAIQHRQKRARYSYIGTKPRGQLHNLNLFTADGCNRGVIMGLEQSRKRSNTRSR